ncbi:hypothetical protein BHE74_00040896 [Ensete ventricosum]|nr:hypothetical protein BHE74_00040896 [Ensete ventricosum]
MEGTKDVMQGSEVFCHRPSSGDSTRSVGRSSMVYYRACGQVPFEWEIEPGQPKNPAESVPLPPLSPPPAMQSARLAPWSRLDHPTPSAKTMRSKRQRRAAESKCVWSNGHPTSATPSPGCFLGGLKLPASGSVKRWDLSRAILGMFGGR